MAQQHPDWSHEITGPEMDDIWGPRDPVTGEPVDTWTGSR